jgi:hypothetical protein
LNIPSKCLKFFLPVILEAKTYIVLLLLLYTVCGREQMGEKLIKASTGIIDWDPIGLAKDYIQGLDYRPMPKWASVISRKRYWERQKYIFPALPPPPPPPPCIVYTMN